jgi:regulatory protein
VTPSLERIEIAGPGSKARRLVFDDGLDPRMTSAAAVKELGLVPEMDISREAVERSLSEVEPALAKDRALRLLGYREHSAAELRRKLLENGYPHDLSHAITQRYVDVELVDDRRFASSWTRSRVAAGYGSRRIKQELVQRGIDPELIDEVMADAIDPDDEVARARRALGRRAAVNRAGRDKLVRRLVSRGFSLSVALRALETDDEDTPE